jgi:two-component system response regulator PilR (NtrC family)
MVERAVALASSSTIGLGDLPAPLSGASGFPMVSPLGTLPSEGLQLDEVVAEFERRIILQALERTRGVRTAAAKLLGVTFRSLRYRLVKLGIDQGDELESDGPKSSHDPRAE